MAELSDVPTFAVILLVGLTVFGLAFVGTQADGIDLGGGEKKDEVVFVDKSFGKVGNAETDFRTIKFRDFTVGETRGDILVDREEQETLKNSLFGGQQVRLKYNATQPREGNVQFEVLGRDGKGAVFVKANGEKVFQEHLIGTGTPNVTIPADSLNTGMNTIVVGTTQGGILSSTEYVIEDLEVRVNDRKFHDFSDRFQLFSYEIQDFVEASINFRVRKAVKTSPLRVTLNGKNIYSGSPVRSTQKLRVTPENSDLSPGGNLIEFKTDSEAVYAIENMDLTVRYLGNTDRKTVNLNFNLEKEELRFAERDDTEEKIRFNYQRLLPAKRKMKVELNDRNWTFTPENGVNELEINPEDLEDKNTLVIRTNTTYQLNNLKIVSEKVE